MVDANIDMVEEESSKDNLLETLSQLSTLRLDLKSTSLSTILTHFQSLNHFIPFLEYQSNSQDLRLGTRKRLKSKGKFMDLVQGWEWGLDLSLSLLDSLHDASEVQQDKSEWMTSKYEWMQSVDSMMTFLMTIHVDFDFECVGHEKVGSVWSWKAMEVLGKWIGSVSSLDDGSCSTEIDSLIRIFMKMNHQRGISVPICFQTDINPSFVGLFLSFYGNSTAGSTFFPWGVVEKRWCFIMATRFMLLDEFTTERKWILSNQLELLYQLLCGVEENGIDLAIPSQSQNDVKENQEEFVTRLCRFLITAPTQSLSFQSFKLLERIHETISKRKQLEFIAFLFSFSVPSLSTLGIDFMKKGMKKEWKQWERQSSQNIFLFISKNTIDDIICLIIFNLSSPLYSVQGDQNKNVLNDSFVLLDRLDIIMQALNLYLFLQIKRRNKEGKEYDVFSEDIRDSIKSSFCTPVKEAVNQAVLNLQDTQSHLVKNILIHRGPQFLNIAPLQLQLLLNQLEIV